MYYGNKIQFQIVFRNKCQQAVANPRGGIPKWARKCEKIAFSPNIWSYEQKKIPSPMKNFRKCLAV